MQSLSEVKAAQKSKIRQLTDLTKAFVNALPKQELAAIMLSGSVARGDFWPGSHGGMIDLTVVKQVGSNATAEDVFGPNESKDVPYHCVRRAGNWYQIAFHSYVNLNVFKSFEEAKKYAFLESVVLWESGTSYTQTLQSIHSWSAGDISVLRQRAIAAIGYLLSDYKNERWKMRSAAEQLHSNLNKAIEHAVACVYYDNQKYAPAEDRRLYYSFELPQKPAGYHDTIAELSRYDISSIKDFDRRLILFQKQILQPLKDLSASAALGAAFELLLSLVKKLRALQQS